MKRSEIIKSGGTISTSIDGDMVETNLLPSRKASIHYQLGKPIVYNQPQQLGIRPVLPLHKRHIFENGVNLCIPNYENYKMQIYPDAYISYREIQQFDTQKVLQRSYDNGNPIRVLWLIPIGTSIYAVVWRHTFFLKQGGPDGAPNIPHTTNSILTEMTNATAEQIDNDVTLPLQMIYLCERESGPLVDHTFNKAFEININFGTAQVPDYQKIYYSFTVNHNFVYSTEYYTAFDRQVTWELKWNDDIKVTGYSHIRRQHYGGPPWTMYAHWYRCKFFNVYDEWCPWSENYDAIDGFESDYDMFYEPFYSFYTCPDNLVTDDGKCDTYAKDLSRGYPEYLGGAILTPHLIYMETQEYYLNYSHNDENPNGAAFTQQCPDDPSPKTYYSWSEFRASETFSQYVKEHIICVSDIGLNFDILRYSETNNVDVTRECNAYGRDPSPSTAFPCYGNEFDVKDHMRENVHKFRFILCPTLDKLRFTSLCDTAMFDWYEDTTNGTQLVIIGLWQTLTKGKQNFNYRIKSCYQNNEAFLVFIKQRGRTWHEADNNDIPNIVLVKAALKQFLADNKFTLLPDFEPNWMASCQEVHVLFYRDSCNFNESIYARETDEGSVVTNVKREQNGGTVTYAVQVETYAKRIQYYVRGIDGWNLSGNWYDFCSLAKVDKTSPPYPVEVMIDDISCFSCGRTGKFPLFSLGAVLIEDRDMII